MANGYPTRSHEPPAMPEGLLPEGMCLACKRRPVEGGGFCETCRKKLADAPRRR